MVKPTAKTGSRRTMTVQEAAEVLGIGQNTAYECVKRGEIPAITLGSRILVIRQGVEDLVSGKAA